MAAVLALAGGLAPASTRAQDVEMLAQHYGTRPPEAYYAEIQRNPRAYRPLRGWRPRLRLENAAVGTGLQARVFWAGAREQSPGPSDFLSFSGSIPTHLPCPPGPSVRRRACH